MLANGKTLDVLEDEGAGIEFGDDADEVSNEPVARVVEDALAD